MNKDIKRGDPVEWIGDSFKGIGIYWATTTDEQSLIFVHGGGAVVIPANTVSKCNEEVSLQFQQLINSK